MEHTKLSIEFDKDLLIKILDDVNNRYIVLFLTVIREELFRNFDPEILFSDIKKKEKKIDDNDEAEEEKEEGDEIIEKFERVFNLYEIFKTNLDRYWGESFSCTWIDLGLCINIRNSHGFDELDDDYIFKMEKPIKIQKSGDHYIIIVPDETLFRIIKKKFKFLTKRDFNSALIRLKGVSCEYSGVIHALISEIGENDYSLSEELYDIIVERGNAYYVINMELKIEKFHERLNELIETKNEFVEIFDSIFTTKSAIKVIKKAFEENKDPIKYLKESKIIKLSEKFSYDNLDKNSDIFVKWHDMLIELLNFHYQMENIETKFLEIKSIYHGKKKEFSYLDFIEKVSYNEDGIEDRIKNILEDLRNQIIPIRDKLDSISKKDLKLLNLDFERFQIMSE